MITEEYLDKHFYNSYTDLSEETILEINDYYDDGRINNVVSGVHSHCFGVFLREEIPKVVYNVIYINGKKSKLQGDCLTLKIDDPERDRLLLIFSRFLAKTYDIDLLDTFNTFQDATRTMCEKVGYFTITNEDLKKLKGGHSTFITPHHKGVIVTPFIVPEDFYKSIFNDIPLIDESLRENYVYLMFNKRNEHFKIGKSIKPHYRERTLQSELPEISMIAAWKVSAKVEKQLHALFKHKRLRGEWFNLSFNDIERLRKYMVDVPIG
jgi:hypothetical protein